MRKFLFAILLPLGLAAAETPLSVWLYPRVWPRHNQLRAEMMSAIRRGDIPAMETACRAGVELIPGDPTWHYNLACALAYREQPGLALTELEKAVLFGFRKPDLIEKDEDLKRISSQPRFAEIVEKARVLAPLPVPGKPVHAEKSFVPGSTVVLDATNTLWNFDTGIYDALLRIEPPARPISEQAASFANSRPTAPERPLVCAWLSEGTAAGNAGDLYQNRDRGHSSIRTGDFPQLTRIEWDADARSALVDLDHPLAAFPAGCAVFGNVSRARINGPLWRSLARVSMTEPGLAGRMDLLYHSNQFWVLVGNKDFGDPVIGDVFPAAAPFQLATKGASWSDIPFLNAALAASASFPIPVKKAILRRRLLGPTLQWLFRRTRKGVSSEKDYLTSKAHPTVFDAESLDAVALVKAAHALRPETVPPAVTLELVNSRLFPVKYPVPLRDYPDNAGELLYATPSSYAFILRSPEPDRTFLFQARAWPENDPSATFVWRVVHGPADAVKIEAPLGENLRSPETGCAQIVLNRRLFNERLDIACFAKTGKTGWGAPSIISFLPVPGEKRTYRKDGRLASIDYSNLEGVYCDPLVSIPRRWRDEYLYADDGTPRGWRRFYGDTPAATFTQDGARVIATGPGGNPSKAVKVKYITRQTQDKVQPLELTYVDDGEPFDLK